MQKPIYLDYAATTPVDERVVKKMVACLSIEGNFANPASRSHVYGWRAEEAVEEARDEIADFLNADPREIVWTSGSTESNNLAIKGIVAPVAAAGKHIVSSEIEHKAVLDSLAYLEQCGAEVSYLKPGDQGNICPEQVEEALRDSTCLVSVMHVNNETGVINDVAAIGQLCRSRGIVFHVDAAQSVGKLPIDVKQMNIDLLSSSAHKIYGPKGVGCLYVRRTTDFELTPLIHGGGHERI